jgi:hypothetical protein
MLNKRLISLLSILLFPILTAKTSDKAESSQDWENSGSVSYSGNYGIKRWPGASPTTAGWGNTILFNDTFKYKKDRYSLMSDLSLEAYYTGNYQKEDINGKKEAYTPSQDLIRGYHFYLNELYGSFDLIDHVSLLVGQKRLIWGPGYSANPTDLLNPPKDALNPIGSVKGTPLAEISYAWDSNLLALIVATDLKERKNGVPESIYRYDDKDHSMVVLRGYTLFAATDIHGSVYFPHNYHNLKNDPQFGLALTRIFADVWETHLEARFEPEVNAVIGAHYQFENDALLSFEYLLNQKGLSEKQFQKIIDFIYAPKVFSRSTPSGVQTNQPSVSTQEARSSSFSMKNYGLLAFQGYKITDDILLNYTMVTNLQDSSSMASPSVSWTPEQWVNLSLSSTFYFRLLSHKGALKPDGKRLSEFEMIPYTSLIALNIKAFY